MSEDSTKLMPGSRKNRDIEHFLNKHEVNLVQISGAAAGSQFTLQQEAYTLGRGDEADLVIDSEGASRKHAAIEFAGGNFRIRDLGSTNGVLVNGQSVEAVELHHGDKIEIGGQVFQFIVDTRDADPEAYPIDADS